jgi:hypothetical protein
MMATLMRLNGYYGKIALNHAKHGDGRFGSLPAVEYTTGRTAGFGGKADVR